MAVFTAQAVRANLRVRDGKRVFYLGQGDRLTPAALDWLKQERVEVLPGYLAKPTGYETPEGDKLSEKPEHMTHLKPTVLVNKTHPRIAFRGELDGLQAVILLCGSQAQRAGYRELAENLRQLLEIARTIMHCDVLEEPWQEQPLCGMTAEQLREHSHFPQKYYDQPHFMPDFSDSSMLLRLNHLRTKIRKTELSACAAFPERTDLIRVLNRMSSLVWIWMIRLKKEETPWKNELTD